MTCWRFGFFYIARYLVKYEYYSVIDQKVNFVSSRGAHLLSAVFSEVDFYLGSVFSLNARQGGDSIHHTYISSLVYIMLTWDWDWFNFELIGKFWVLGAPTLFW